MTTSTARTVVIGSPSGFGGASGYGTMPAGAPNRFLYQPQPGEFRDCAVDAAQALDGEQTSTCSVNGAPVRAPVPVRGCLTLAVQADGLAVETIDHPAPSPIVRALQQAFFERAALQCGCCTPGMILQAAELLAETAEPSRETIREALSGNLCRCTGYHAIVDAVAMAAGRLRDQG